MPKRESFNTREERNRRFGELRQAGTPGLIRWSDSYQKSPLEGGGGDIWFLAYETPYPTLVEVADAPTT